MLPAWLLEAVLPRVRSRFLAWTFTAVFLWFGSACFAATSWNQETVQEPRWFRVTSNALVIDPSGTPVMLYGGNHLYQSMLVGTQWVRSIIDSAPGAGTDSSVTQDVNGKLHVVYQKQVAGSSGGWASSYATNVGGEWVLEDLPTSIPARWITADGTSRPHFAYFNGSTLSYASKTTNGWQTAAIDSLVPNLSSVDFLPRLSMSVDSSNHVHIAYLGYLPGYQSTGETVLKHAYSTSSGWVIETIDARHGMSTDVSMVMDSAGFAHVAYRANYGSGAQLFYATNMSGSWVTEVADGNAATGRHPSIAVDAAGKAHISYMSWTGSPAAATLNYATNDSGNWVIRALESAAYDSGGTSIAARLSGDVHVVYFDLGTKRARHFRSGSSGWTASTVDTSADTSTAWLPDATAVGSYPNITVDNLGTLHATYVKPFVQNHPEAYGPLFYATNMSGMWQSEKIITSYGKQSAIAIDGNRRAHVLFNELGSVQYATNRSGSWVAEQIQAVTRNSWTQKFALGLALDSSSHAHAAYFTGDGLSGTATLHYANNSSGSWQTQVVTMLSPQPGSSLGSDFSASIYVDSSNVVHIGYLDGTGNVAYATNQSGLWATQTVAPIDPVFPWADVSMVVRPLAKIYMAAQTKYCPPGFGTCIILGIEYSTNGAGTWQREMVDVSPYYTDQAQAVVGVTSLALDANGAPRIGYVYSETRTAAPTGTISHRLRSARKVGSLWRVSQIESRSYNFSAQNQTGVDANGNAFVAFQDWQNGALRLARAQETPAPMIDFILVPSDPDFGTVQVGSPQSREITITSTGQQALTINSIRLMNDPDNSFALGFSAGANACGPGPITLNPGTICAVNVSFDPKAATTVQAIVEVASNDPEVSSLSIGFIGTGAPGTSTSGSAAASAGGGGGCFIATAAFGTAMAPEVKYLRAFRDQYLLTTEWGVWFVNQYYRYSPPMAEWIRAHDAVRAVVRIALAPLIAISKWLVGFESASPEIPLAA